MANVLVAYTLWLFFGILGVHHFYLKRDRQAFVWWSTLGGFFGLGWLHDFFRIPAYVQHANEEEAYVQQAIREEGYVQEANVTVNESSYFQQANVNEDGEEDADEDGDNLNNNNANNVQGGRSMRVSAFRLVGMIAVGYLFAYLAMFVLPPEVYNANRSRYRNFVVVFMLTVPPLAAALGVHLVGNIGELRVSYKVCALGSLLGDFWLFADPSNVGMCCLLSTGLSYFKGLDWKSRPRRRRGKCRRLTTLAAYGTLYLLVWGCSLYFNAKVTTRDGEEVLLRDALHNFFNSPAWTQTKETLRLVWNNIRVNGWSSFYRHIVDQIDPQGEEHAYKVLGVDSSASQKDIKQAYKRLAVEWHPDKFQGSEEQQQKAQDKFMEIQKAYETLSKIKARRAQRNKKSTGVVRDEF